MLFQLTCEGVDCSGKPFTWVYNFYSDHVVRMVGSQEDRFYNVKNFYEFYGDDIKYYMNHFKYPYDIVTFYMSGVVYNFERDVAVNFLLAIRHNMKACSMYHGVING